MKTLRKEKINEVLITNELNAIYKLKNELLKSFPEVELILFGSKVREYSKHRFWIFGVFLTSDIVKSKVLIIIKPNMFAKRLKNVKKLLFQSYKKKKRKKLVILLVPQNA